MEGKRERARGSEVEGGAESDVGAEAATNEDSHGERTTALLAKLRRELVKYDICGGSGYRYATSTDRPAPPRSLAAPLHGALLVTAQPLPQSHNPWGGFHCARRAKPDSSAMPQCHRVRSLHQAG